MTRPLVSVIVVNWNRRELLRACLGALRGQTLQDFETIVVDNGSTDGSAAVFEDSELSPITLIENQDNRGFCAANNQGIAAARGEFIALLNNDAEAHPGWLAALLDAIVLAPDVGMAASKILVHEDRRRIDKAGHLIYPDGQNRGRGSGAIDVGQYDEIEETAWPDGCAALYRRSMLDEIGGFDEDFFAYADDAELGLRGRLAGWRCIYAPQAVVYHRLGSTLGRHSEQRIFLIERNRIWLAAKLFPFRLLWLSPFYFIVRLIATAAASLAGRGEARKASSAISLPLLIKCVLRANWAALRGLPAILRKRRDVARFRKLSAPESVRLLRRFRIPLAELVGRSQ
jgi:GT2 family glycosyltransferase